MPERSVERWPAGGMGASTQRALDDISPPHRLRRWLLGGSGPGLTPQLGLTRRTSSTYHQFSLGWVLMGRLKLDDVAGLSFEYHELDQILDLA